MDNPTLFFKQLNLMDSFGFFQDQKMKFEKMKKKKNELLSKKDTSSRVLSDALQSWIDIRSGVSGVSFIESTFDK